MIRSAVRVVNNICWLRACLLIGKMASMHIISVLFTSE